jgi:hypothetical protein
MDKTYGIEQVLELLQFVKDLALCIEACKSDGKVNAFDLVHVIKLSPSLISAVRGAGDVHLELKDLNGEEMEILLKKLQEAMFELVGAFT